MGSQAVSYTDLLIVGAGPAGMMAAAWASQYQMSTRIIDKNSARTSKGQADGLQSRTLEIFDSFGVVDYVWKKGFHDIEMGIWEADKNGCAQRLQRVLCQKVGLSRYTQISIHQGAIEQSLLDVIRPKFSVERNVTPEELELDHSIVDENDAYPITITLRHNRRTPNANESNDTQKTTDNSHGDSPSGTDNAGERQRVEREGLEIVKAKYLVGCDGAHSWTRKQLGISLEGKQSDSIWGVMDIVPITDFPDIRQSCAIHSAKYGSILNIPRENRLNRLYIQLNRDSQDPVFDRTQVTPETMLHVAQNILKPYTLEFRHCDWWSIYQIGQRIAPNFSVASRIFLAGDAVHTHSPKLGQGMNVSMQDSYNLGWKLGSVITGRSPRALLASYEDERRRVALQLLAVDEEIARFYARAKSEAADSTNGDETDFGAIRERMYEFLAGIGVTYGPSVLVAESQGALATKITLGARFPSHQVLNQAEARPIQLGDMLPSDARWRVIVFAGDITDPVQARRMQQLGDALAAPDSFLRRFTPPGQRIDSVIEILTLHNAPRTAVSLADFHPIFRPFDEELGWDYWKVFVSDVPHHGVFVDAYEKYGVGKDGCMLVCRPDQHVGHVGALEDVAAVASYFAGVLIPCVGSSSGKMGGVDVEGAPGHVGDGC